MSDEILKIETAEEAKKLLDAINNAELNGIPVPTTKKDEEVKRLVEWIYDKNKLTIDGEIMPFIYSCPFCGKEPEIEYFDEEGYRTTGYDELTDSAGIVCNNCDVIMRQQIVFQKDVKDIIKKWNERM